MTGTVIDTRESQNPEPVFVFERPGGESGG